MIWKHALCNVATLFAAIAARAEPPPYVPATAYYILPEVELRPGTADLWVWRGKRYLMRAVTVSDYRQHMRQRSPKWGTVHLPMAAFRELVRPLREFTHPQEVWAG